MVPAFDFAGLDLLVDSVRPALRTLGLGLHFLGIVSPPLLNYSRGEERGRLWKKINLQ